jgi:hypothetical protein
MRVALREYHCWVSLALGFACLIVGQWTSSAVGLALFFVAVVLLFDGATLMWARARTGGGLHDHRQ